VPLPPRRRRVGRRGDLTPLGSESVKATPVSATALEAVFATVIVRTEVPSTGIEAGPKTLESVTFGALTTSVAVAAEAFVAP